MPKQSLYQLVKTIAKRGKIQITPPRKAAAQPARAASPARAAPIGVIRVDAPIARPCGSAAKGQEDSYSKEELIALAKASGVDHKQDMDSLCAALGISPHQSQVDLPAKKCDTKARGDDRYTRDEVKRLAMARGIKISGKTMTELCEEVGIHRAQVLPRGVSSSVSPSRSIPRVSPPRVSPPRVSPPRVSPPRVPLSRSSSSLSSYSSGSSVSSYESAPVPKQPSRAALRKQAQLFDNPSIWGRPEMDNSGLFSQQVSSSSIPFEKPTAISSPVFQQPRMGLAEPSSSSATPMGNIVEQRSGPQKSSLSAEERQSLVDDLASIQPPSGRRRSVRLQKK